MNETHPNTNPEQQPDIGFHPRVWIGSLADYNAGRLHGEWLNAAVEHEELLDGVQRILAASEERGAEEWGIFDYDEFGSFRINEYDDLTTVTAVARGIRDHGLAFASWAELHQADDIMLAGFEDHYLGEYDSPAAFAQQVIDDLEIQAALQKAVPGWITGHVRLDRDGIARDLVASGDVDIETSPSGVYVFWGA